MTCLFIHLIRSSRDDPITDNFVLWQDTSMWQLTPCTANGRIRLRITSWLLTAKTWQRFSGALIKQHCEPKKTAIFENELLKKNDGISCKIGFLVFTKCKEIHICEQTTKKPLATVVSVLKSNHTTDNDIMFRKLEIRALWLTNDRPFI